jgi:hypothetical protein
MDVNVLHLAQRITDAFLWWPKMHEHISRYVQTFPTCQRLAKVHKRVRVPLKETPINNEVFADISLDVYGGD